MRTEGWKPSALDRNESVDETPPEFGLRPLSIDRRKKSRLFYYTKSCAIAELAKKKMNVDGGLEAVRPGPGQVSSRDFVLNTAPSTLHRWMKKSRLSQ